MRLRLLAFARLRELLGWSEREIDAREGASIHDVWEELARECSPLAALRASTRAALNGELVRDWHAPVENGAEIAFLPPSSGG